MRKSKSSKVKPTRKLAGLWFATAVLVLAGISAVMAAQETEGPSAEAHGLEAPALCTVSDSYILCSDKTYYAPSDHVHISGSGFLPDAVLTLRVTRPDGSIVNGDGASTPGSDTVTSNSGGDFGVQATPTPIPYVFGVQQFPTAGGPLASGLPDGLFRVILASGGAMALAIGLYLIAERRRS